MKKHKKVSGMSNDMFSEILHDSLPGVGMIAAHEIKAYLPDSVRTALGDNAPMIINGLGIAIGLGAPHLLKGEAKQYARSLGSGVAGQCIYSMYGNLRGFTAIGNADNNAYALTGAQKEALRKKLDELVKRGVGNADNNAYSLAGGRPAGDDFGLNGNDNGLTHQYGLPSGSGGVYGM